MPSNHPISLHSISCHHKSVHGFAILYVCIIIWFISVTLPPATSTGFRFHTSIFALSCFIAQPLTHSRHWLSIWVNGEWRNTRTYLSLVLNHLVYTTQLSTYFIIHCCFMCIQFCLPNHYCKLFYSSHSPSTRDTLTSINIDSHR